MLNNSFTVKFISSRNCFLLLSEANIKKLSYNKIVKLQYGQNELHFSCVSSPLIKDNNVIGVSSLYAKLNGICENESVYLSDVTRLPILGQITISPLSFEDYEIMESASNLIQETMLDQIRVVNKNQKIVVWVSKWLHASVKIDETDSLDSGVLAALTEVNITHPSTFNAGAMYASQNRKNSATRTNSIAGEVDGLVLSPEMIRLEKYMRAKRSMVYRVHPIQLPHSMSNADRIAYQPFNIFLFKKDLPKGCSSYNGVMLCSLRKITVPNAKDDSVETSNIAVRVCIVDDYFSRFSKQIRPCFSEKVISRKYPIVFVASKFMSSMNISVGAKVALSHLSQCQTDVLSIELTAVNKKHTNLHDDFVKYAREQIKYDKCVLSCNVPLEIVENIFCSLKFNPGVEYCVMDEQLMKKVKIYENSETVISRQDFTAETDAIVTNTNETFDGLEGFNKIVNDVVKLLSMKSSGENVLISGKAGCGKSTLCKAVSRRLSDGPTYVYVAHVSCKVLKGKSVEGVTKVLTEEFERAAYREPSLVVLDDLEALCGRSDTVAGGDGAVQTQESLYWERVGEVVSGLVGRCSDREVNVLATCESVARLGERVASARGAHLFRTAFHMGALDATERRCALLCALGVSEDDCTWLDEATLRTEGLTIGELVALCSRATFEACKRDGGTAAVVCREDVETARAAVARLAAGDATEPEDSDDAPVLNDVGALGEAKGEFVRGVLWPARYSRLLRSAPLRCARGLLLYGPPGCGKTLAVRACARTYGLRTLVVRGPELLSKYVGASELAVRRVFERARDLRPCLLFFDEFEALAPRRGHDSTGVTDRVVNQLLAALDGVERLESDVVVVAATSRPDLVDPALLRPGRLDRAVACRPPATTAERRDVLAALARRLHLASDVDLERVARLADGRTGADLQAALYTAQLDAVERMARNGGEMQVELTQARLEEAVRATRPSLTERQLADYQRIYARWEGTSNDKTPGDKTQVTQLVRKQKTTLA